MKKGYSMTSYSFARTTETETEDSTRLDPVFLLVLCPSAEGLYTVTHLFTVSGN